MGEVLSATAIFLMVMAGVALLDLVADCGDSRRRQLPISSRGKNQAEADGDSEVRREETRASSTVFEIGGNGVPVVIEIQADREQEELPHVYM